MIVKGIADHMQVLYGQRWSGIKAPGFLNISHLNEKGETVGEYFCITLFMPSYIIDGMGGMQSYVDKHFNGGIS